MKDRHINIISDSSLLKSIYATVDDQLKPNRFTAAIVLLVKFVFYFSLLLFCYYWMMNAQYTIVFLFSYIAFGLFSVLLGFNFAHDFSHNTVFKNKKINSFCFVIIYTIVGAHAESWRFRHTHSHHYAPNVKDYDSDLQITDLIRVEPGSNYKWFHQYQHWYAPFAYMTYSLYWVFIKDMLIYFNDKDYPRKKTLAYHLSFWLQKAAYVSIAVIVPLLFAGQHWYITATAFIAMHLVQSLFLLFTFFITHHVEKTEYFCADSEGFIKTSWINNQVKSSNDFYPFSEAANFIFGGFNNHIAHHLFPHINHIYYPKLNRILYGVLRVHHIEPNMTGFFGGVRSHLKHLKKMGIKPCGGDCNKCDLSRQKITEPFVSLFRIK